MGFKNRDGFCFTVLLMLFGCGSPAVPAANPATSSWSELLRNATGKTVQMTMWQGDPGINRYMNHYVVPELKKRFGITLNISAGQGNSIISTMMNEKQAGKTKGDLDICWINGETFYQLREIDGLYGPFVQLLPNARLIDFSNPFIGFDFQKPVENMECPWGNVQLCLIYNSQQVTDPPRTRGALAAWVVAHPGKFTIGTDFTGLTLLKSMLIDIAGGEEQLAGAFNETKYKKYSAALWVYINQIKPFFWKEGKTFPAAVAPMHQLFSQGELDFTMSNNDGEVDNKVEKGVLPKTSRAYVLDGGTIQNSHYLGILKNSPDPGTAMVVINFMISPEAQLQKQRPSVWGDGTVLDLQKLTPSERAGFESLAARSYGPPRIEIQSKALKELAPEYMIRLSDDFRKQVIEK